MTIQNNPQPIQAKELMNKICHTQENNLNKDILIEMARINKNETSNCIFPYEKWEVQIWSSDHNPPHFHIKCDNLDVSFEIQNGVNLETTASSQSTDFQYIVSNVKKWLSSKSFAQPKLTNQENAQLIWNQLH